MDNVIDVFFIEEPLSIYHKSKKPSCEVKGLRFEGVFERKGFLEGKHPQNTGD
jgi:hypothetical protein